MEEIDEKFEAKVSYIERMVRNIKILYSRFENHLTIYPNSIIKS